LGDIYKNGTRSKERSLSGTLTKIMIPNCYLAFTQRRKVSNILPQIKCNSNYIQSPIRDECYLLSRSLMLESLSCLPPIVPHRFATNSLPRTCVSRSAPHPPPPHGSFVRLTGRQMDVYTLYLETP